MLERPKSREETPKEGDGNGRDISRYRTAAIYTASHKTQVLLTYCFTVSPGFFLQIVQGCPSGTYSGIANDEKIFLRINILGGSGGTAYKSGG